MIKRLNSKGFSLLEVLVAVLILAVGLLGVSALNLASNQFNYSSLLRTQADFLALDLAERMRANSGEARDGSYDIDKMDDPAPALPDDKDGCAGLSVDGTTIDCDPKALANYEKAYWFTMLVDKLPQGAATIETDTSVSPNKITITIQWVDIDSNDNNDEENDNNKNSRTIQEQKFVFSL